MNRFEVYFKYSLLPDEPKEKLKVRNGLIYVDVEGDDIDASADARFRLRVLGYKQVRVKRVIPGKNSIIRNGQIDLSVTKIPEEVN